ncbi:MAG: SlyX family protein [Nannocystaceae bacterium]|nr:SlyX family protein [bacterium]
MEDRIVDLEVRLAYQDKIIADLDEVVRAFADRVVKLERELEVVKDTLKAGVPEVGPQDEKPPHY